MKRLGVKAQKWLKAFHVFFASVWLGATLASMTILISAKTVTEAGVFQGYYAAAVNIGSLVIPLTSVLTLITGVLICWLTAWGFFKYWSVVLQIAAWALVFMIAVLWLDPALETARALAVTDGTLARQNIEFTAASNTAIKLGITNVIIIGITTVVATIKPWGRTRKVRA